jgi:hypothetical protein
MRSRTRCRSIFHSYRALISKIENIKTRYKLTTLDTTGVAPSENGIRRGSDCQLEAPRLNPGSWRWQTRCPCQMRRGRCPGPLPSSGTLRSWCLSFTAGCKETRSLTERPVDGCSAPPSRPGGVPYLFWGHPSSAQRP